MKDVSIKDKIFNSDIFNDDLLIETLPLDNKKKLILKEKLSIIKKNLEEKDFFYDLQLSLLIKKILSDSPKKILIQLPDGLKPKAFLIKEFLDFCMKKEIINKTDIFFWAGSNFGSCDIPVYLKDFDMIIHFGHSPWA